MATCGRDDNCGIFRPQASSHLAILIWEMTTTCNVPGGCALYDNIVCIDMEFLKYKSNFRSEAYAGSCQSLLWKVSFLARRVPRYLAVQGRLQNSLQNSDLSDQSNPSPFPIPMFISVIMP